MRKLLILLFLSTVVLALPAVALADEGSRGKLVLGGSFVLQPNETLYGDLVVMGGSATLQKGSAVSGNIVVIGGSTEVAGTVTGDLIVIGGSAKLTATALVRGRVTTVGGALDRQPGARVLGEVVEGFDMPWQGWRGPRVVSAIRYWPFRILRGIVNTISALLFTLALGALVIVLLPEQTEQVAKVILAEPLLSLGTGLLTAIVLPLLMIVLVITCIGPLLLLLALLVAGLFGWIAVGLLIGRKILEAINAQDTSLVVAAVVGITIITLLARVPCLGWLFFLLVGSLGLGAVILTRFGTTPYPWPANGKPSGAEAPVLLPPEAESDKPITLTGGGDSSTSVDKGNS